MGRKILGINFFGSDRIIQRLMSKSYLDRKEAWAKKMAGSSDLSRKERSRDRLPPGQHTVEKLPVLDLGIQPRIVEEGWVLEVDGEVENKLKLDWESLSKFNYVEELKKCGDNIYRKNQYWEFISIEGKPEYVPVLAQILNLPENLYLDLQ